MSGGTTHNIRITVTVLPEGEVMANITGIDTNGRVCHYIDALTQLANDLSERMQHAYMLDLGEKLCDGITLQQLVDFENDAQTL